MFIMNRSNFFQFTSSFNSVVLIAQYCITKLIWHLYYLASLKLDILGDIDMKIRHVM